MNSQQIRQTFLDYFQKQGHTSVKSSSLIPENDPTLLFANAGMNQFKNCFLGLEKRDYVRAASSQKCVRAGGKHNDLENVGFTARHHTFFEMLGNFSFGDYFKKDAIHFAWELLTKTYGIPKEKLYVTVFQNDDEAEEIWHKQEGVPKDRIFRLGEKDNFWRMGDTGPCGPCTEIFFDHGEFAGKEKDPYKGILAGEDRFVEIWNLVFMQFFEREPGKLEPLPKPSVDTGSGLERMVAALQGRYNNYNTDLFLPIIQVATNKLNLDIEEMIQAELSFKKDHSLQRVGNWNKDKLTDTLAALRVMADHTRSTSFLIADGALPSNEGRGYVLRRIMRRAIRYGRKLSTDQSFLNDMSKSLIESMCSAYPELRDRQSIILSTIQDEESRFISTLDKGTEVLESALTDLKKSQQKTLSAQMAFKLYDTFGFPIDLTRLMSEEKGFQVDEAGFEREMESAKAKARASWKGKSISSDEAHLIELSQSESKNAKTVFRGYEALTATSKVLKLSDGKSNVSQLKEGQTGIVILDQTPFYAEGGGQTGDLGWIKDANGAELKVINCTKQYDVHLHFVEVVKGHVSLNSSVQPIVADLERRNTAAHHSATHLLHAALHKVLGNHATQAGQMVDSQRIRFDFTHNKSVTPAELKQIEDLVNEQISEAHDVETKIMSHSDALKAGAMALFGEKYESDVRVLKMGSFSMELCGGTHVKNTSQIRLFKIVSESGVSAGVRRIEALAGDQAVRYVYQNMQENLQARQVAGLTENWSQYLEASQKSLVSWIAERQDEIKSLHKEIKKAQGQKINVDDLMSSAFSLGSNSRALVTRVEVQDKDVLAQLVDQLKSKISSGVVVVIGEGEPTSPIIVATTKDLTQSYPAGVILKEVSGLMNGKGGGRPDFAQGSVTYTNEGFEKAKEALKQKSR